MAAEVVVAPTTGQIVEQIKNMLWGPNIKEEVFLQWAQGLYFSPHENTALIQAEGGPCAVIAPLQAFILKRLLQNLEPNQDTAAWHAFRPEACDELLVKAMTEVLVQANDDQPEAKYSVALLDKPSDDLANGQLPNEQTEGVESVLQQQVADSSVFHSLLRIHTLSSVEEVERFFIENIATFKEKYGVLLLLYSVICTRGIPQMQLESAELVDPLIHTVFGYGSQSIINLMLSGRAVNNVCDHERDIGGLALKGMDRQNSIGFLTLLETLRYIEVGTFLKSPINSVWVLGSETHLSVLFSTEKKLSGPETQPEKAKRIFRKFDNDGNNFILTDCLQDVLVEIGLFSDTEYVDMVKKKLDSHDDGIILLTSFMNEFYPEEIRTYPDTFVLYHYNGLPRSNPEKKVKYHRGQAILLESTVDSILDSDPMLTVLQTKWPSIEVQWDMNQNPSLN